MFLFLLALFLRTEAFKYTLHHSTWPRLTLFPGQQQTHSLNPTSRDYLFVSPTVFKSLFTSPLVSTRYRKWAGGLGDILRMTSLQGNVVVPCVPIQLQSSSSAFGPRLVIGCPFPLFPNPGAEALKPGFLDRQVIGLPLKM